MVKIMKRRAFLKVLDWLFFHQPSKNEKELK